MNATRSSPRYRLRVRGELACFTRPELKVDRMSYHVITPSSARAVVEAILWKPAIRFHIHRIAVLAPIRFMNIKRNELKDVAPLNNIRAMMRGKAVEPFFIDETNDKGQLINRAQRGAAILRDVDYHVDLSFTLTHRAGPGDNILKFSSMFERRLANGQQHYAPYLGCREFPAIVEPARDDDPAPIPEDMNLGRMLLDVDYGRPNRPVFFDAEMKQGVIEVPSLTRREDAAGEVA